MSRQRVGVLLIAVFLVALAGRGTLYRVDQGERDIVTRLGRVLRYDDAPGLHVKLPFLDRVRLVDGRLRTLSSDAQSLATADKKTVLVSTYVTWRVGDVLKYYLTIGARSADAAQRLAQVIASGLRQQCAARPLQAIVSGGRQDIMNALTAAAAAQARPFGVEVVDVRIARVDLPDDQVVYERMKARHERIASGLRARAAEAAATIRADADRQREVLLADAYRRAQRIRGEGDARAAAIGAAAYGRAPGFYALYRSLRAYQAAFKSKSDIMIVDPSADFFKYMKNPGR